MLCHQTISCHGFCAATEDVLNWTLGLHIYYGTTIIKARFWASRFLLIHVHPCSCFIHGKMAVMPSQIPPITEPALLTRCAWESNSINCTALTVVLYTTYVTLDHKSSHKGKFFWNGDLYVNIWPRCNYMKIWNLRVQKNLNIEKIAFKVVQMKFLAMHITNQKLN